MEVTSEGREEGRDDGLYPGHSRTGLDFHLAWEITIFIAAIISVASVAAELTMELSHETEHMLHLIDGIAICLFAIDIGWKYRVYRHHAAGRSTTSFIRHNWLDIIAIIPLFRIFRLGRFARLARVARFSRTTRVMRATKAVKAGEKAASASTHATRALSTSEKAASASEQAAKALTTTERAAETVEKGHKGVSTVAHSRHGSHALKDLKDEGH